MSQRFLWLLQSQWPYRAARVLLGLVFIWAGGAKLIAPRAFAQVISGYGLVPEFLLVPVALALPVLELFTGLGLLLDRRGSLQSVFGLLVMFLVVLGYAIVRDLDVDCGCFSATELKARSSLRTAFARDLGLMAVTGYLFLFRRNQGRLLPASYGTSTGQNR